MLGFLLFQGLVALVVVLIVRARTKRTPKQTDNASQYLDAIGQELSQPHPSLKKIKEIYTAYRPIQEAPPTPVEEPRQDKTAYQKDYTPAPSVPQAQPTSVPEQTAAVVEKKKTHTGLNVMLYIGSLLIIAGIGSLITAVSTSDIVKFVVLSSVVTIFYVGGLILRRNKTIAPAGNAFVGTALAVLPFAWFIFNGFLHISPELSWLFTSLVGVIFYVIATCIINNQIIAYFTIAFIISLTCSMSACFQWALIWYFVAIMVVAAILGVIQMLSKKLQLGAFAKPIAISGRWLPVITALASLCVAPTAEAYQYVIIFGLCAVQSGINWLSVCAKQDAVIFRLSVQAALLAAFLVFDNNFCDAGFALSILALAQAVVSVILQYKKDSVELALLIVMLGISAISIFCSAVTSTPIKASVYTTIYSVLCIIFCLFAKIRAKQPIWGFVGLAPVAILPFCLNRIIDECTNFSVASSCFDVIYFVAVLLIFIIWVRQRTKKYELSQMFNIFTWLVMSINSILAFVCSLSVHNIVVSSTFTIQNVLIDATLLLILAFAWFCNGHLLKKPVFKEVGYYIGLAFICRIVDFIFHSMTNPNISLWIICISVILGLGLIVMGFLAPRLYGQRQAEQDRTTIATTAITTFNIVRQLIGLILITIATFCFGASVHNIVVSSTFTIQNVLIDATLLLILAFAWFCNGHLLKKPVFKEVGYYIGLAFICRIVDFIFHSMTNPNISLWIICISVILGLGLIVMGFLAPRLYGQSKNTSNNQIRQIFGTLVISIFIGCVALFSSDFVWSLMFLGVETIFLVIGVLKKWKWMWIIGTVGDILAALWFTREISFMWFIFAGIALFVIVIRQLYKNTKKENTKKDQK